MIHQIVNYRVKKEKLKDVKKALVELLNEVHKNQDLTPIYEAFQKTDLCSFVHLIAFQDKKAQENHSNSSYVQRFKEILYPSCEEQPVFI
ncbi:MAG: hypothetical protein IEMM0008_0536 [bacterium]|nr:MAG: hypothetical protein IEMM0008_0536 [bacterium]